MSKNEDSIPLTREGLLKALDLIHLNGEQLRLLRERKLDKETMGWAAHHLSECHECCLVASELTAQEIENALIGTEYGRSDLIEQTVNYYFETLSEAKQETDKKS